MNEHVCELHSPRLNQQILFGGKYLIGQCQRGIETPSVNRTQGCCLFLFFIFRLFLTCRIHSVSRMALRVGHILFRNERGGVALWSNTSSISLNWGRGDVKQDFYIYILHDNCFQVINLVTFLFFSFLSSASFFFFW